MSINLLADTTEVETTSKLDIINMNMSRGLPWDKRNAPETLDDVILPDHILNSVKFKLEKNKLTHMTFHSGPGTGKTTVARLIPKLLKTQSIEYNGSKLNSEILKDLEAYDRQACIGPPRVVILDECDRARADIWDMLRSIIGAAKNTIYILTANQSHKIPPPILSRCPAISFAHSDDEIKRPIFKRLYEIAVKEVKSEHGDDIVIIPLKPKEEPDESSFVGKGVVDQRTIAQIAKHHYPDIRAMINSLEQTYDENLGSIKGIPILTNTAHLESLWELLLAGKDISARMYFNENITDYTTFFPQFCDYVQAKCDKSFRWGLGVIISEAEFRDSTGNVNRELNVTRNMFGRMLTLMNVVPNE